MERDQTTGKAGKMRIDTSQLQEGDLVKCRNDIKGEDEYAIAIRFGLRSYSNHDAMVVKVAGNWFIAEAVSPVSKITTIEEYQDRMSKGYKVEFYRLHDVSQEDRQRMAEYYVDNLLGLKYPRKYRMMLLASRLVNAFGLWPYHLTWCSQLVKRACVAVLPDCLDGPNGKKKRLFTPKTFENRILQGLFDHIRPAITSRG